MSLWVYSSGNIAPKRFRTSQFGSLTTLAVGLKYREFPVWCSRPPLRREEEPGIYEFTPTTFTNPRVEAQHEASVSASPGADRGPRRRRGICRMPRVRRHLRSQRVQRHGHRRAQPGQRGLTSPFAAVAFNPGRRLRARSLPSTWEQRMVTLVTSNDGNPIGLKVDGLVPSGV